MNPKLYRFLQAGLLVGMAAFLLVKILDGSLVWYIHQRFWPLTVAAVALLFVMGIMSLQATRRATGGHDHDHDHSHEHHDHDHSHDHPEPWGLFFLALPLVVGILVPARPLDSSAVDSKGLVSAAPLVANAAGDPRFGVAPEDRNLLDWNRIFYSGQDVSPYLGQVANVSGFVYRDETLGQNRFMVGRFAIMCCSADAFAIGMAVEWPQAAQFEKDTWIQVRGPVQLIEVDGVSTPIIHAETVERIEQPDSPYLYP